MELFDAIAGRRSVRRFTQAPVPDEDIRRILEAGTLAPSANNVQPWQFLVVRDRAVLTKMADAVREMVDRMIPHAEGEKQAQRLAAYRTNYYVFFEKAPVVLVVLMTAYDASADRLLKRMGHTDEQVRRLRPLPGLQSVSAAVQNMLLAIHALGYGSCWMTGPLVAQEAFEKLLGYGPEMTAVALLPVGVPDERPAARSRKAMQEVMRVIG